MDAFDLGSVVAHVKADTAPFMQGISSMKSGLGDLSTAAGVAFAGMAVAAGAAFSVKEAVEFNKQMTLIQTQAGASKQEVQNMSKAVLDLGGTVAQGPIQLSEALFHIESAGYRGAAAMDILKVASEGAAVGNADLESVTNALVAAEATHIKGLGDVSNAMAVLNAIVGSGNMRMEDLTGALSTGVLPAAKAFGLSIQDVGAALDTMTINGVPAEEAATRLRMTFSLLAAPTGKATDALKTVGITSDQLAHTMREKGLIAALTELHSHLINSGQDATQQAQTISAAFGGGKTSAGILTLINNLDTMQKSMDNINSTSKDFSKDVAAAADTPAEKWHMFLGGLQSDAIKVGTGLIPLALDLLQWANNFGKAIVDTAHDITTVIFFIGNLLGGAANQLTWYIFNVINWFKRLPGDIINALGDFGHLLYDVGKSMLQGMINGLDSMAKNVEDKVKGVANGIKDVAKKILGIFSPSKVFHELGTNVGQGLIDGLNSMQDAVGDASKNIATAVIKPSVSVMNSGTLATSSPNITTHIGSVHIGNDVDANNFMKRLTRNQELAVKGLTPVR